MGELSRARELITASAPELAVLLTKDQRTSDCMVEKLYRQSMGHLETKGDA